MSQIFKGEIIIEQGRDSKWQASLLLSGGDPYILMGYGPSNTHPYEVESCPWHSTSKEAIEELCNWLKSIKLEGEK